MITVISLSSNIKNLKNDIANYDDVKQAINLNNCTDYRFYSNSELLIYKGNKIEYSCFYKGYKNKKYITNIYNRDAGLVYEYNIKY